MPEYLPPLQLPTGMAEQLIALKSRAGDPWAALAQNLGNDVAKGAATYRERQANKPLTPDQTATIQQGKVPQGLTREQGLSLAEKQAAARAQAGKTIVPVDQGVLDLYKKAGMQAPTDPQVSQREFQAVSQLANHAANSTILDESMAAALSKKSGLPFEAGQAVDNKILAGLEKPVAAAKAPSGSQEAQWTQLFRLTNPSAAMRGTPLGTAAIANQRANRALEILQDDKMTPQRKSLAITDLAGIIQGGSPHEQEIASQNYGAYQDMWKNLVQKITAEPQIIKQPETVAEIRDLVRGVKGIDNDIIKSNLEESETFFADRIKAHGQDKWNKYKKQVLSSLDYGMKDEKDKDRSKSSGFSLPAAADIDAELKRRGVQ